MEKIARRRILLSLAAVIVGVPAWIAWKKRTLIQFFGFTKYPPFPTTPYPTAVTELNDSEMDSLWRLFSALAGRWNLSDVTRSQFDDMIRLKTRELPSYAEEYRRAIAWLNKSSTVEEIQMKIADASSQVMSDANPESEGAHIRTFVLLEFCVYLIFNGGYRTFGLTGYPGAPMGPMGYRKADIQ